MKRTVLRYGSLLALLIFFLKTIEYRFFIRSLAIEYYIGTVALLFSAIGVWVGLKMTGKKSAATPNSGDFQPDDSKLRELSISKREYEVLALMAQGLSNQEIADKLFVSLNTVKTHSSNIFSKLDAKRRTQAIQRAKELQLIR